MAAIDDVTTWIVEFRNSRNLVPEGSPLWAYKVTDDELNKLQRAFKRLFSSYHANTVFNSYISRIDQPLVMYMATWLQRNTQGRVKWEKLTESIGLPYESSVRGKLIDCVKSGLKKWKLSVHVTSSNRYLDTLYCHGGFPRSDLLEISNSHLMEYFENVLRHYASFEHSSNLQALAKVELSSLPETLQQEPFSQLAVELIEYLIELRDEYHLYDCSDPFAMLEIRYSHWKNDIPFLVIDAEAHQLVNKLLNKTSKLVRREQNPVRIKRYLKNTGLEFEITAEVYVNHTIHPDDLSSVFGSVVLPNHFELSTCISEGTRFRTASFSFRSGVAPRWMVSIIDNVVRESIAQSELNFQLYADGENFCEGIYYRGEELSNDSPWLFDNKSGSLALLGQGSIRTKEQSVIIVSASQPRRLSNMSQLEELGLLKNSDRKLYKASGSFEIESAIGAFHISTDSTEIFDFKIKVHGHSFDKIQSDIPVYCGKPELIWNKDVGKEVFEKNDFFWINQAKEKRLFFNSNVVGTGSIVWIKDNAVFWHHKCTIFPEKFDVELIHIEMQNFEVKFCELGKATIGMETGLEAWLVDSPDYLAGFYFCEINIPNLLTDFIGFRVYWNDDIRTEVLINIPIVLDSVMLTDRKGIPYKDPESGRLTVADLNQSNVLIKFEAELDVVRVKADLIDKEKSVATVSGDFKVENFGDKYKAGGRNLANLAARLFRHGTEPDNSVKLTFFANNAILETQIQHVHRYKKVLNVENNIVSFGKLPKFLNEQNSLELKLLPIWDTTIPPVILSKVESKNGRFLYQIPTISNYGSWLLFGSNSISVRPRIIDFEVPMLKKQDKELGGLGQLLREALQPNSRSDIYIEELDETSLEHAVKYLKFNNSSSSFDFRQIDKVINNMSVNHDHKGWDYIEKLVLILDEIEASTFHVIKRLMKSSEALTLLLLKSTDKFNAIWDLADSLPFEWCAIPFAAWKKAITIVKRKRTIGFEALLLSSPTVYDDIVAQLFAPLKDKGEYYNTVVDIALRKLNFPLEIWPVEHHFDNTQFIGKQFLEAKSDLYKTHEGRLMSLSQSRKADEQLIQLIENTWSKSALPRDLQGFFKSDKGNDNRSDVTKRAQKLTTEVPIWVAFNNMGIFNHDLPSWALGSLNFSLTQIQQFDRQWLQKSMALATAAACIHLLESKAGI